MSNELRKGVVIQFEDKERTIYPVSLAQLRKLREAIKDIDFDAIDAIPDDKTINAMVQAAQVILGKNEPEFAADYDKVEEIVDISSFSQMLAAAMGADPNE